MKVKTTKRACLFIIISTIAMSLYLQLSVITLYPRSLDISFTENPSSSNRIVMINNVAYSVLNISQYMLSVATNWQIAHTDNGSTDKIMVYSAFLVYNDKTNSTETMIVSLLNVEQKRVSILGSYFNKELTLMDTVTCSIDLSTNVPSHSPTLRYNTAYIICPFPSNSSSPMYISVSSSRRGQGMDDIDLSNFLKLLWKQAGEGDQPPFQFGLCVQPTFNYDLVYEFVQWLEYYRMMSVQHFTFYNISFGPKVSCLLKSLDNLEISVLPWNVPVRDMRHQLQFNGQTAQGNDCVLRYRNVAKYVVFVDLDEYLIPNYRIARNYPELFLKIFKNHPPGVAAHAQFQFRSAFFGTDLSVQMAHNFRNIEREPKTMEDLLVYRQVRRQRMLYPYRVRSKFITVPNLVEEPGVHYLERSIHSHHGDELEVPWDLAFVHHYRNYRCGTECNDTSQLDDTSARQYTSSLFLQVQKALLLYNLKCPKGSSTEEEDFN